MVVAIRIEKHIQDILNLVRKESTKGDYRFFSLVFSTFHEAIFAI